jgi:death-on-curing protein
VTVATYVTLEDAIAIHADQLATYGGAAGLRDEGLLLSALLRPQTGYYGDLIEEAAALWESLAMNHAFIDGNKRVAFACTVVFLAANGVGIEASQQDAIDFIYEHLEAGTFRKGVIEAWLRSRAIPYVSP